MTVCECERSSGATLAQVLLLANSDEIENKIADGNGRVAKLVKEKKPTPEIDRGTVPDGLRAPADAGRAEAQTVAYVEKADGQAAGARGRAVGDPEHARSSCSIID